MNKEPLKLKQVLPYIDFGISIRIYDLISINGDQWEIVFEGPPYDVPWIYAERHFIEADDNEGNEAMCPYIDDNGQACLRITLADEEDRI